MAPRFGDDDEQAPEFDDFSDDKHEEGTENEESDSDSEDDEHEKPLDKPRQDAIYDVSGLNQKVDDISWPRDVAWIHSLSVTRHTDKDVDVEDDLAREMSFYSLALEGAREAYEKLQAMRVPFLRPEDYYAEMVKSDNHMHKVKEVLMNQQKKIEEQQERRKAREAKKFAKEVQVEKMKERNKQKKQDIESVKKWRKMRQDTDFSRGEDEFPLDLGDSDKKNSNKRKRGPGSAPWDRSGGKAGNNKPGFKDGRNKSRQKRDAKFGHGGRKGMNKKNTAESSGDMSGFKRPRKQQKRN